MASAGKHWANFQRISFRLHDPDDVPYPDKFLSVSHYMCRDKGDLPPSLSRRTILNFTTTISTDLKILFFGDSLGLQFSQSFDATVLSEGEEHFHTVLREFSNGPNNIFRHHCLVITAPIRGSGVSAYWRNSGLISKSNMVPTPQCKEKERVRGGWSPTNQGMELLRQSYFARNQTSVVGSFDAVVMRIPHGWITLDLITKERIIESINLYNQYLGVETVIVTTLPLNNNVKTPSDWKNIIKVNNIIRDIARNWTLPHPGNEGVRWVLVQEYGNFTNQILWTNAQHLGYNVSMPDFSLKDGWEEQGVEFLLDRLPSSTWAPAIPMVCSNHSRGSENCILNKISPDGMHWCMEHLGPRISASVACLLGCVYNGEGLELLNSNTTHSHASLNIRQCEQQCNDRFMSLVPVHERWLGDNVTIYSKAN